jgi:hypothetical protein
MKACDRKSRLHIRPSPSSQTDLLPSDHHHSQAFSCSFFLSFGNSIIIFIGIFKLIQSRLWRLVFRPIRIFSETLQNLFSNIDDISRTHSLRNFRPLSRLSCHPAIRFSFPNFILIHFKEASNDVSRQHSGETSCQN